MKRAVAVLLVLILSAGSAAAVARGSGSRGGGGGHTGSSMGSHVGAHMGPRAMPVGAHTGSPHMGSRVVVGTRPVFVHSKPFFHSHSHGFIGGTVIVAAGPYFPYYPYYYPPYPYPPMYDTPAPVYMEQPAYQQAPVYVEQPAYQQQQQPPQVRYYCADTGKYYPDVPTCTTPWMKVVP